MKLNQRKLVSFTRKEVRDILTQYMRNHTGIGKLIPNNPVYRLDVFGDSKQLEHEIIISIGFEEDAEYKA